MKTLTIFLLLTALSLPEVCAQLKDLDKRIENKVKRKVDQKADRAIDNASPLVPPVMMKEIRLPTTHYR